MSPHHTTKSAIDDMEYRLILPKRDNKDRRISPNEIQAFAEKFSEQFGGATIFPSILGCWKNRQTGKHQCEENVLITAIRDSEDMREKGKNMALQTEEDRKWLEMVAEEARTHFGQFSIITGEDAVEVNFVSSEEAPEIPEERYGLDVFTKLI